MQRSLKHSATIVFLAGAALLGVAQPLAESKSDSANHAFHHLEAPGLENLFAVGTRIYSGSSPEGEAAFVALQKLGIKTLISVDGAKPGIEMAARYGMRYLHLPFGYNGVPATNAAQLVKAAESLSGPIYVHCHHGRHRGPAAVAIICQGVEGWTPALAVAWLHAAGTATNYTGLYKSVAEFRPPSADQLKRMPSNFPSCAQTSGLVETMVKIDERFDTIKANRKADFHAPPDQPALSPVPESLLLSELFREAHRTQLGAQHGEIFLKELAKAEAATGELHARLEELNSDRGAAKRDAAEAAFQSVAKSCSSCHKAFRD